MNPSSPSFLTRRLRRAENKVYFQSEMAERLIDGNRLSSDLQGRSGMIWFVSGRLCDAGPTGIGDLLGYWGGEAVYRGRDIDETTKIHLKMLGRSTVIEAVTPIAKVDAAFGIFDTLLVDFLIANGLQKDRVSMDFPVTADIEPSEIVGLHRYGDAEFFRLTGSNKWTGFNLAEHNVGDD